MEDLLIKEGSLLKGHFLLTSGKHSDAYVQCARLTEKPEIAKKVAEKIAEKIKDLEFETIVGPAMGGLLIGYELASFLNKRFVFTERKDKEMALRRGFKFKPGERVLICEDVVTTGISAVETKKVIEEAGGEVIGLASIIDRTPEPISLPLYSAYRAEVNTYDPDECPLCKEGIELIQPGSRKI